MKGLVGITSCGCIGGGVGGLGGGVGDVGGGGGGGGGGCIVRVLLSL